MVPQAIANAEPDLSQGGEDPLERSNLPSQIVLLPKNTVWLVGIGGVSHGRSSKL